MIVYQTNDWNLSIIKIFREMMKKKSKSNLMHICHTYVGMQKKNLAAE